METTLKAPKTTTLTDFSWAGQQGCGYEIHMGQTRLTGGQPLVDVLCRNQEQCQGTDGCVSDSGNVIGTYLHGFFDTPSVTSRWLHLIGLDGLQPEEQLHGPAGRDKAYEQLAEHAAQHLNVNAILELIAKPKRGESE